jgi:hypothetical protein
MIRIIQFAWNLPIIWFLMPNAWENPETKHRLREWFTRKNLVKAWRVTKIVWWDR